MSGIVIDNGRIIAPEDYEQKCKDVIVRLDEMLLNGIEEKDSYDEVKIPKGGIKKVYKKMSKDTLMPKLTQVSISTALNRILRVYRPLNEIEAREISDIDYLKGFNYYCDIILHINKYMVYLPDKMTFCAFVNITNDIYNIFLNDTRYSQVFKGIEDSFIQSNFTASESGMVDSKTVLSKLQTKDAGHNLVKNPEALTVNNTFLIDKEKSRQQLDRFESMIRQIEKK